MGMISRYDPRTRYRQKNQQRVSLLIGLALTGLMCGVLGFGIGYQAAQVDEGAFEKQLSMVEAERDKLQQTVQRLLADSHTAQARYEQIEATLQAELPQEGPLKDIVRLIRAQLDAGGNAERLAELIRTQSPPRNCTDPETRRFIVATEQNKAADNTMILAEGALTVQAVGEAAQTKDGKPEAWYDPSRPVKLIFTVKGPLGTEVIERANNLPLSQILVVGNKEYRMTFAEGVRSFLKLTFDTCDYP